MAFILQTFFTSLPFIIPIVVMMIARMRGFRWPRRQKPLYWAALTSYGLALVAFAMHAASASGGAEAFFLAFYGRPPALTPWGYTGYFCQGLAALLLMFVVNWDTIELLRDGIAKRKAAKANQMGEEDRKG